MKILTGELDKKLKSKNRINILIICLMTVVLAAALFLCIWYQTRELAVLYSILCTVFTFLYLMFVWMIGYVSMSPIHKYRNVIKKYNSNVGHSRIVIKYLYTKEETETLNRISCKCHVFSMDDVHDRKIQFYTEKEVVTNFVEGETYEIYYYQHFIGEYHRCTPGSKETD